MASFCPTLPSAFSLSLSSPIAPFTQSRECNCIRRMQQGRSRESS
jgi:hypothetical protein